MKRCNLRSNPVLNYLIFVMLMIRYEVRAVQLAKLKQMSTEGGSLSNNNACEVEMLEAKPVRMSMEPGSPKD